MEGKKFLIIQTAFIGDVVLATPLAEVLKDRFPQAQIHLVVRKGNESLLDNHPCVDHVFVWYKKEGKFRQLFRLVKTLRQHDYEEVFNLQRFFSSGLITTMCRSKRKTGFDKNPLSLFYSRKVSHKIPHIKSGQALNEVDRNLALLEEPSIEKIRPKLYPANADYKVVAGIKSDRPFFVLAPASVWFTKQWPINKWQQLLRRLPVSHDVFIVGAPDEAEWAGQLMEAHPKARNLCGELSMLQTVALMEEAVRVFTNDSAPLHFASAANAVHTAIFCSTVPEFGFGPLSGKSRIAETQLDLACRPCGLHGKKACPLKHFNCAHSISPTQVFNGVEYYEAIEKHITHEQLSQVGGFFLERSQQVGIHFSSGDYLLTAYSNYQNVLEQFKGFVNSAEMLLLVKDIGALRYFVNKVPAAVFEVLDNRTENDLLIHFPAIHPPDETMEDAIQLPIRLTQHPDLVRLLEHSKHALLMLPLQASIVEDVELANQVDFYIPFSSKFSLNNIHTIKVANDGSVEVVNTA